MIHAYLMYGFPTQTTQETIDSLEMVRQLFEIGILQSGFWHQFAMTAHSPVGINPEKYNVINHSVEVGTFANNDMIHEEKSGMDHQQFSYGLKKSLFNYMHGVGFDLSLQEWFDFKIPRTTIPKFYIEDVLNNETFSGHKPNQKIVWLGGIPSLKTSTKMKKGVSYENTMLAIHTKIEAVEIRVEKEIGEWLVQFIKDLKQNPKTLTFQQMKSDFEEKLQMDFDVFIYSKPAERIKEVALLVV